MLRSGFFYPMPKAVCVKLDWWFQSLPKSLRDYWKLFTEGKDSIGEKQAQYEFGQFRLDVEQKQLLRNGELLPLGQAEFNILAILVREAGRLVSRERLLRECWLAADAEEGKLNVSISLLRKALQDNTGDTKHIQTIPKAGYRFIASVTELRESTSISDSLQVRRSIPPLVLRIAILVVAGIAWVSFRPRHWRIGHSWPAGSTDAATGSSLNPGQSAMQLRFIAAYGPTDSTEIWLEDRTAKNERC